MINPLTEINVESLQNQRAAALNNTTPPQRHNLIAMVEEWIAQLIADTKSKASQVLNALRRLELLREFPMRQALAEARIELQRRSMAHREALLQDRRADKAEKKARQAAKEAAVDEKPIAPQKAKAKSVVDREECKVAAPINKKPTEPPTPPSEEAAEVSAAPGTPQTTEELHAMEWDLRSVFDFGDLRAFEFCTGGQIVRFPDRSTGKAQINYPTNFKPSSDFVPRTDEYLILPHALPPAFAASAKARREPKSSTRPRIAPIIKDDRPDWSLFTKPLTTGLWPDNTMLPVDWQYGDPIPGVSDEV